MSDRVRLLQALRDAGSRGLTTFEIRRGGISGNPSERRRELLLEGHLIEAEPCKEGHRRGKRFILTHDAEPDAVSGADAEIDPSRCSVSATQGAPPPAEPAPDSPGTGAGSLFELPEQRPRSAALHDYEDAA